MTTLEAARAIYRQTKAPWADCMRWAAQCRQEAAEAQERQRAAFFAARRERLEGKRFRDLLRAAPSALEVRSAEGRPGMGVEYCPRDVAV